MVTKVEIEAHAYSEFIWVRFLQKITKRYIQCLADTLYGIHIS